MNMPIPRLFTRIHMPSERDIPLFLLRFYVIGALGFMLPVLRPLFKMLTPFALLMCFALVLFYELTTTRKRGMSHFLIFIGVVYLISLLAEIVGVNTGVLFGPYKYGNGLGIKIWHTPLMIGINWILVTLGAAAISQRMSTLLGFAETRYVGAVFRIVVASFLMIMLDFLLERIAPWMDMWSWLTVRVPGRNYLVWLLLSICFQTYYVAGKIQQRTHVAAVLFLLQALFFLALLLFIRYIY